MRINEEKEASNGGRTALLEQPGKRGVQIADAAKILEVSYATIRNWLKTGYLTGYSDGSVDPKSIDAFLQEYAGREKLISRANKLRKDAHDHDALVFKYMKMADTPAGSLHLLGNEYQDSLSDAYRNREGVYYTPEYIVSDLFKVPDDDVSAKTFCDPCCGSGNFIIRALEAGFRPENITGYDTDPVAVKITRKRIFDVTGYKTPRIYNRDFLEDAVKCESAYDYIYTNPPWGKKLTKDKRAFYASFFGSGKSNDTCSFFFFFCLRILKSGGRLGFLLPGAFFNIAAYETVRRQALNYSIERLVDYNRPFEGLVTRAQGIVLQAKNKPRQPSMICCETEGMRHKRKQRSFAKNPGAIFNFHCSPESASVIEHAFRIPHITLRGRARWGLGIVTGNNRKWIKKVPGEGCFPVVKGSDVGIEKLKEPTCFIPEDFTLYHQVAPLDLYRADEKLIYRFISSDLCFFRDDKQRFMLNSANMLIPDDEFPISCLQLADLLNSSFINWLFRNIFNTHKILRGDLEMLPLHVGYFDCHDTFDENLYLSCLGLKKEGVETYCRKS